MIWFWWILALVLGIGEIFTVEFLLLWFALGALVSGVTALFFPFLGQLGVFVLIPFLLTIFSRKILHKQNIATNISALIGQDALVIDSVKKNYCGCGKVKVGGEFWQAYTDGEEIHPGQIVSIDEVDGTKLRVSLKR